MDSPHFGYTYVCVNKVSASSRSSEGNIMANKPRTSKTVASKAAKLLKTSKSKDVKSVSGSALENRKKKGTS